jgi:uncharacterized damage-inducible protein DinB
MKIAVIFILSLNVAQHISAQSLKSVLVEQLKTTHDKQNWFVPVNAALDGVTAEQAVWTDGSGNHSIGQLANHLLFWNERQVVKFKGQKEAPFSGNNEETFNSFNKEQWAQTVKKLNEVLSELEKIAQNADEASLKSLAETLANISTHNAYHTGQIIFIRKLQGSWDPQKGVK